MRKKIFICPVCGNILYSNPKEAVRIMRCINCSFKVRKLFAEEISEKEFNGVGIS